MYGRDSIASIAFHCRELRLFYERTAQLTSCESAPLVRPAFRSQHIRPKALTDSDMIHRRSLSGFDPGLDLANTARKALWASHSGLWAVQSALWHFYGYQWMIFPHERPLTTEQ
jgi:hypothetical protein